MRRRGNIIRSNCKMKTPNPSTVYILITKTKHKKTAQSLKDMAARKARVLFGIPGKIYVMISDKPPEKAFVIPNADLLTN